MDVSYQGDLFTNGANGPTNLSSLHPLQCAPDVAQCGRGPGRASLEVTNLSDKYYFLTRFDQFTLTGITDGQPGRPREWAFTVKRKF